MTQILLTNDDGIHAPGLALLRRALEGLGEVTTIAPDRDTSAVARGISIGRPLRLTAAVFGDGDHRGGDLAAGVGPAGRGDGEGRGFCAPADGYPGLAVDGTPVDCVRVALLGVLQPLPDLVVSGVNFGGNMGNDVTYSGTVGAALEAALHSVPSIAFSVESREPRHLESALPFIHDLTAQLLRAPLPAGTALNVNLPERPAGEFRGLKVTSLGGSSRHDRVVIESDDGAGGEHWLRNRRAPLEPWAMTDFDAVEDGYVSLTPIHSELTSREGLAALAGRPLHDLVDVQQAAGVAVATAADPDDRAPGRAAASAPVVPSAVARTVASGVS